MNRTGTPANAPSMTSARAPLTGRYKVWLVAALFSQLGDASLYFALGWAAAGYGGKAAGLVVSMIVIPRTVFSLLGGAVGDRHGARRVMIICDAAMLVVAAALGLTSSHLGTHLGFLLCAALLIGVVDAFYLPSSGSMPRRLVAPEQVGRAVALRQGGSQLVAMVGGPLGGVLVAFAGFAAAAWADAVTFAVVLVVLILVRERFAQPPAAPERNLLREAGDGLRVAVRTPALAPVLMLVAGSTGLIMPVTLLLIPLLARSKSWTAADAGIIVGAQGTGMILVTLIVARLGTMHRPGRVAAYALAAVAAGQLSLAMSAGPRYAAAGAFAAGCGIGLFVAHLSPVLLTATPESHLARIQALSTAVQSLALLLSINVLGAVANAWAPRVAILLCAAGLVFCATAAFASPAIRRIS